MRRDGTLVYVESDGSERPVEFHTNLADAPVPPDDEGLTDEQLKRFRHMSPIKRLRWSLSLSQQEFADRFGIPVGTLRDWEQGRTEPDAPARAYIKVIMKDPDGVARVIAETDDGSKAA
jgi:putative transcriptional regulator